MSYLDNFSIWNNKALVRFDEIGAEIKSLPNGAEKRRLRERLAWFNQLLAGAGDTNISTDADETEKIRLDLLTKLIMEADLDPVTTAIQHIVPMPVGPTTILTAPHNTLPGLQGGDINNRIHLTLAEYGLLYSALQGVTWGGIGGSSVYANPVLAAALNAKQNALPFNANADQFLNGAGAFTGVSWGQIIAKPTTLAAAGFTSSDTLFDGKYIQMGSPLTGLITTSPTPINSTTSVLQAFGQLQAQINMLSGGSLVNPMTSLGDIIVGGVSGVPTRLGLGTTGYVLTSNGSTAIWAPAPSSSGITSLNGLIASTQTFGTPGTSGTAPAWASSVSTHTLNIPMASATGVTAGLISKAQYDAFVTLTGSQALSNKTGLISQWTNDVGYITSASPTPPGGSSGEIQYNNAGSFAGTAGMVFDGTFVKANASAFLVADNADPTKAVRFFVNSISTGTTRSLTFQNLDGTIALLGNNLSQFNNDPNFQTLTQVNSLISAATVGLLDDRGNYNASGNTFPASGGSGTSGAVLKGDLWTISVAGTLGGQAVTAGDTVRALVDTPGQTSSNWAIGETNIGYVPANASLSNLSAVSINASLVPQTGLSLGGSSTPWQFLYLYGAGSFGANNFQITGNPTSARVWTLQDATDTFVGRATTDTLTNKTLTTPVINVGSDATGDIYYRSSGGAFTRLGVGSNGQVLTLASGLPSWAASGSGSGTVNSGTARRLALYASTGTAVSDTLGGSDATITVASQAAARTYTIPDAGTNASFIMSELAQTMNGVKTFGSAIIAPGVTGASTLLLKPTTNGTSAIQLQNSSGTAILSVDTTNSRVGINTTPSYTMHILGSETNPIFYVGSSNSTVGCQFQLAATATSAKSFILGVGHGGHTIVPSSFFIYDATAATYNLTMNTSGKVLIASYSFFSPLAPSARLHLIDTTEQLRIGYNTTNYVTATVGSGGGITFDSVGSAPLFTFSDAVTINGTLTLSAQNLATDTSTGMKIGTATSQKIGFFNATPIVQLTTAVAASTFVANSSLIANDTATWDGYTMGQIVKALRNLGLLA